MKPVRFTKSEFHAVQALNRGEATADQQTRALKWIMNKAGGIGDDVFADTARMTDFNLGRRWVALQLARIIQTPATPALMEKLPDE